MMSTNESTQHDQIRGPQLSVLLPRHDEIGILTQAVYLISMMTAVVLLVCNVIRIAAAADSLLWWLPFISVAGMIVADFVSGLVHWIADTWGEIDMPIFGRRFLHPFRVHHANPDDFLSRSFINTNGDVAMLVSPVLAIALLMPLESQVLLFVNVFLTACCATALPTNQVHQWSHMPSPPTFVRFLQDHGIILGRQAHRQHHCPPHIDNYCIALGWCNRGLMGVSFWRRLERLITWAAGVLPRADESNFLRESEHMVSRQHSGTSHDI
jgi:hypothetical protein